MVEGWREAVEQVKQETRPEFTAGAQWMLRAVRDSLRNYPNGGGDIVVMQEVERIKRAEARRLRDMLLAELTSW